MMCEGVGSQYAAARLLLTPRLMWTASYMFACKMQFGGCIIYFQLAHILLIWG